MVGEMLNLHKNHFSKHFVNHVCGTLADVRLIIAFDLLMKVNRAGCWLGNTLLAASLCYLMALFAQGVMGGQPLPFQF